MLELCRCPNIYGPDCIYIYKKSAHFLLSNIYIYAKNIYKYIEQFQLCQVTGFINLQTVY